MKCYKCAQEGKDTEAVGICVVCGMGLCEGHVKITEVSFWEIHFLSGTGVTSLGLEGRVERKAPRFLCDECYAQVAASRSGNVQFQEVL